MIINPTFNTTLSEGYILQMPKEANRLAITIRYKTFYDRSIKIKLIIQILVGI